MKNIIKTCFGAVFVILGVMTFVFDFMTVRNAVDIIGEDAYPLQWLSVAGAVLCAGGCALIIPRTEQQTENVSESEEVFKRSFDVKGNWWASFKQGLNHNLEELGHVLKILH